METAVTYNRFSPGPDQREESITGQLRENHRLAKQKNLTVIHDYIDRCISGKTDNRPQFLQMLKDAEKGLFKYIICYQTNRFARNTYDAVVHKHKLKKFGVKVIYSKMSIPQGPEGVIFERFMEAFDEYYSEELKQKVLRGQYDNALQGKFLGGRLPYGYKLDENNKYIIDEERSVIVREIFTRYAAGEKARDICNDLNKRGIRTSTGGEFGKNSLPCILHNPKYMGVYDFESKDPDLEAIHSEDTVPAIVTKELFERAQKRMESNRHKKSKKKPDDDVIFLLSGKAFDGNCGGALIGDSGTSRNGVTHYYYTCTNKKHKKGCKTKSVKKDWLENAIVEATRAILDNRNLTEKIGQWIVQLQEKNIDDSMLKVAQSELKNTQKSIKNIMNAIEQGIITDTTRERLLELEVRQAQLESEIKLETHKIHAPKVAKEQVIFWLEQFKNGDSRTDDYKKYIIETLVNAVVLHQDVITIAYNYADNEIVDLPISILKGSSDSVRISLLNWAAEDSNLRPHPYQGCALTT